MSKIYRPTWAEIDLKALKSNLSLLRNFVKKEVGIMAVVKANAYGHGIIPVSKALMEEDVDYFGVATVDEALKLRNAGIDTPVLVLGSVLEQEAEVAVKNDITLTLCNDYLLAILEKISIAYNVPAKVHVKIDTGMGRIGVWHEDAVEFIKKTHMSEYLDLEGVYTHFSAAGRDEMFTKLQIESFTRVLETLEEEKIEIKIKHAANSIAIIDWKDTHLSLVRTGIMVYGVYPKGDFHEAFRLNPVMSLKTKIVYLKNVPAGRSISYGRTYITQKPTKIATIPIGYADGYGRILSNKAEALVNGQQVKVVGVVTMDQTLLDVGEVEDVQVGDEVVLVGRQEDQEIPIEKIAKLSGTIPYEILATVTDRVPRVYK